MKRCFQLGLIVVCCAVAPMVWSEDTFPVLKVGSEVYSNVTVTTVTATDIYFQHSRGMGSAKLKNLEPAVQKHFKFDPAKAEQLEKNRRQANADYRADVAKTAAAEAAVRASKTNRAEDDDDLPDLKDPSISARSFLGSRPPGLVLEKWLTPAPDVNGKFLIIDFWATWCGPCRETIPLLNAIQENYKDKVVVIGLTDEPEEAVQKMKSPVINYSIATDTQRRLYMAVGIQAIPHCLLIDPHGIVRYEGHPDFLNSKAGMEHMLSKYE